MKYDIGIGIVSIGKQMFNRSMMSVIVCDVSTILASMVCYDRSSD